MDIPLSRDLEQKLSRLAAQQGRAREAVVIEAIERLVSYDDWFVQEVQKGLEAADSGEFLEHEQVRKLIQQRYPS